MTLRAFSSGGGTQSTAALVLAARGDIDFPLFIFSNVGNDSENPETLEHVERYQKPYAEAHGIEFVERRRTTRTGETPSIIEWIENGQRSVPIPIHLMPSGGIGNRGCTALYKIKVIEKELKRRGATKANKAVVGIGISTNEVERAGSAEDPRSPTTIREYPLIDLRISRADCKRIIAEEGLPQPGRSACFFCPLKKRDEWRELARKRPDLFEKACALEERLHAKGLELGRGEMFFTAQGTFLRNLYDGNEMVLFEDDELEVCAGSCMT